MSLVYIINGRARSGKDTLQGFLKTEYKYRSYRTSSFSSIDPVRYLLSDAGFDLSAKTPEDRVLLSTVGAAVEAHSAFRTKACISHVQRIAAATHDRPVVTFLQVRENQMITGLRARLLNLGHIPVKLLVQSDRSEAPCNPADAEADLMPYDYLVKNNGTLEDLEQEAIALADLVAMRNGLKNAS